MRKHRLAAQGKQETLRFEGDRTRRLGPKTLKNGKRWQWFGQSPRGYSVGGKFQENAGYKRYKRIRQRRESRLAEHDLDC